MLSIKGKYKDIECSKKLGKFRTSNRNLTADVRHRKFAGNGNLKVQHSKLFSIVSYLFKYGTDKCHAI